MLSSYDSSADYWKVIKDKDGKVAKVLDDGDYEHLNIFNADGKQENQIAYNKESSLVNAILNAAGGLPAEQRGQENWDRVNRLMIKDGLDWEQGNGWYAKTEVAKEERAKAIAERNAPAISKEYKEPSMLEKAGEVIVRVESLNREAQEANNEAYRVMGQMLLGGLQKLFGWGQKPQEEQSAKVEKQEQITHITNKEFNQSMVESTNGLPSPSACAITSYSWLLNEYGSSLKRVGKL